MTAAELLDELTQTLAGQHVAKPRREALLLLSDVLHHPVGTPLSHPEAPVEAAQVEAARRATTARARGAPLPYATGVAHFRALRLNVDRRVLIPRPETEGLVERVLAWQAGRGAGGVVWDVCTGSGCVALSLAHEGSFGVVVGSDRYPEALEVARRNTSAIHRPVSWVLADLLVPAAAGTLDAVVANPPYVTATEWAGLDPGVRDHEPRVALVAEEDGMALIARLAVEAWSALRPGGILAVEVDSVRADGARARAVAAGFASARIEDDLFGRPRYLVASKE